MSDTPLRKYCVIGTPVAHSKSPELFARFFEERGLTDSCEYVINEIRTQDELESFIADMRDGRWEGCNVTMPWKNAVFTMVDECSVFSKLTTAVNTVRRRPDGTLYGTSTDGAGMLWAIRTATDSAKESGTIGGRPLGEMNVVILGAGGSARSIIAAFATEGIEHCHIVCRGGSNREHAERVCENAGRKYEFIDFYDIDKVSAIISDADIVINCTPLGMIPQEERLPVPEGTVFKTGAIVADAVYNPEETRLLQMARTQGCIYVTGRMMLEGQARVAADVLLEGEHYV